MKTLKKTLIFLTVLMVATMIASCGNQSNSGGNSNSQESSNSSESSFPNVEDLGGDKDKPFDTPITKFD